MKYVMKGTKEDEKDDRKNGRYNGFDLFNNLFISK